MRCSGRPKVAGRGCAMVAALGVEKEKRPRLTSESRALEQPSPRTAHGEKVGGQVHESKRNLGTFLVIAAPNTDPLRRLDPNLGSSAETRKNRIIYTNG